MALFQRKSHETLADAPDVFAAQDESFVAPVSEVGETPLGAVPYGWSPTLDELLAMKDDGTFENVRVPLVTKAARLRYDKFIKLNNKKFIPGQTYKLHPIIASELRGAIERYEAIPTEQMTGKSNVTPELLEELRYQAAAQVRA